MLELTPQEQAIKDLAEKYRSDIMRYESAPEAADLATQALVSLEQKCTHRHTTTYQYSSVKDWVVCEICGKGWFAE